MKKIFYAFLSLALLVSCGESIDGFAINGDLRGDLENGTLIFLKRADEQGRPIDLDTARIEEGKFEFRGEAGAPELHYIFIDQHNGNIPVVLEEGAISVSGQKDSLTYTKVKGTPQNDLFADFLETSRSFSDRAMSMSDDMRTATMQQDSAGMTSLRDEYGELQEEAKQFELDFVTENPNALISAILLNRMLTMGILPQAEVKELYEALSAEIKATAPGKSIKDKLDKSVATSIGSKAPNFSAPTPTGEELALNDVLGKATILDFWAAWCRPCRAENPNVVRVYEKYKEKGLSILGVSLDRKADDWKKAIKDDGLVWNHVSNVQYFDEIAKLYNVNAIPATFILDENGIIVAKNLRGPALEQKISELLQ